jgi:hypothetical protein
MNFRVDPLSHEALVIARKTDRLIVETPMWHQYLNEGADSVERPRNSGVCPDEIKQARDIGVTAAMLASRWSAQKNEPATIELLAELLPEAAITPPNRWDAFAEELVAKSILGQYASKVALKAYSRASTIKVIST